MVRRGCPKLSIDNFIKHHMMPKAKEEYLRHHPELIGTKLTEANIVAQLILYYLPKKESDLIEEEYIQWLSKL